MRDFFKKGYKMVFVLDRSKKPLDMITNAEARILLRKKLAVIHKIYPFTIRLRDNSCVSNDRSYTVKIDPGSKHTGIAITDDKDQVVMLAEIEHRGHIIKKNLGSRRAVRQKRRNRKTRYRPSRFLNRTKPEGWLAPSIKSRADNVINFIKKYKKLINIDKVMIENVSFDVTQMSSNTKIYGVAYQQGPLYQNKLRSFIFNRSNNKCVYCGAKATEIDHIVPRTKGGTNSVHNLVASCRACNQMKSNKTLKEFGKIMNKNFSHLEPKKLPKDASIVQTARNYMVKEITKLVSDTTLHDACFTKYNRDQLGLPKQHYLKSVRGFQTGDIVKAIVPNGLKQGEYLGRVAIRSRGYFDIKTKNNLVKDIGYKYCHLIQRGDGYSYNYKECDLLSGKK